MERSVESRYVSTVFREERLRLFIYIMIEYNATVMFPLLHSLPETEHSECSFPSLIGIICSFKMAIQLTHSMQQT